MGKFCSKCGKEDKSNSNFCQFCGNALTETVAAERVSAEPAQKNGMAIAGFILSFFEPLLGLIFSIIGVSKSKNLNGAGKGLAIAGIIISAIGLVFRIFFGLVLISGIIEGASYYYY